MVDVLKVIKNRTPKVEIAIKNVHLNHPLETFKTILVLNTFPAPIFNFGFELAHLPAWSLKWNRSYYYSFRSIIGCIVHINLIYH